MAEAQKIRIRIVIRSPGGAARGVADTVQRREAADPPATRSASKGRAPLLAATLAGLVLAGTAGWNLLPGTAARGPLSENLAPAVLASDDGIQVTAPVADAAVASAVALESASTAVAPAAIEEPGRSTSLLPSPPATESAPPPSAMLVPAVGAATPETPAFAEVTPAAGTAEELPMAAAPSPAEADAEALDSLALIEAGIPDRASAAVAVGSREAPAIPSAEAVTAATWTDATSGQVSERILAPEPSSSLATASAASAADSLEQVLSERLTRARLSNGIYRREPREPAGPVVEVAGPGSRKIYYFTELNGLRGESVRHRWIHQGRTVASLRFRIGGDRWRVYSSKNLSVHMPGDWEVVVEGAQGQPLGRAQFQVRGDS